MTLNFEKSAHPWIYVSKDVLNHFLVNSNAKISLRRAKNVLYFLFCILVDRPMKKLWPPPPPGYAIEYSQFFFPLDQTETLSEQYQTERSWVKVVPNGWLVPALAAVEEVA